MKVLDRPLKPWQQFLCRFVRPWDGTNDLAYYEAIGDDVAWQAATDNDVASIVGHTLADAVGPERVPGRWREAHDAVARQLSAYMAELDRVAVLLAEHGIPMVALKNSGIARAIYPCHGCSPMGDMDVLVEKQNFLTAHRLLLENGYHFEFRSPLEEATLEAAERTGGAEYSKMLPGGEHLWFELQWRSVAGRWIRPDQEPSAEALVARSLPVEGSAVRVLRPEDNLLQVCLHTAKHSYVRAPGFRLHLDVERITRHQQVDWDAFLRRVVAAQAKTPVFFALALPADLLGSPIPDEVLGALRPPVWKLRLLARWLQGAGLFNPEERKFSNPRFLAFSALLYDDLGGLRRALFPDGAFIRQQYGVRNGMLVPAYHVRRLASLAFRRTL